MADIQKVIKGLECCQPPYDCHNCPYDWDHCFMKNQLHKDALELLKEQSRKQVLSFGDGYAEGYKAKAQEIVRCKDCKWRNTNACFCKSKYDVQEDWYCSEAQR